MKNRCFVLSIFAIGLLVASIEAASRYVPSKADPVAESWRWRSFPELKSVGLRFVDEDSKKNIWFAADAGVVRYDGRNWTSYGSDEGLPDLPINYILITEDDRVFAGSDEGIDEFREGRWQRFFPREPNFMFPINSMSPSGEGLFWASSPWGALLVKENTHTLYTSQQAVDSLKIIAPSLNAQAIPTTGVPEVSWAECVGVMASCGEDIGISRGNTQHLIWAVAEGSPADRLGLEVGDELFSSYSVPVNFMESLFGPEGEPIELLVRRRGEPEPRIFEVGREMVNGTYSNFMVSHTIEDREGNLWFGLQSGEIIRYSKREHIFDNPNAWEVFDHEDGLSIGLTPRIQELENGSIWTISNDRVGGGINQFDGNDWTHFRLESLPNGSDNSTSIIQRKDGSVWIGGFKLHVSYEGGWSVYTVEDVPMPYHRSRLMETRDGDMWIVGLGQDAVMLDSSYESWNSYLGLRFECEGRGDSIWFTSEKGTVVANRLNEWIEYGPEDGLSFTPRSLFSARDGTVWAIGTSEQGTLISRFDDMRGQWKSEVHPEIFFNSTRSNAFFESENGSLWFGSYNGVLRFDGEKWIRYDPPRTPTQVYAIDQTADGVMWFGGDHLRRYDGEKWMPVLEPQWLASWIESLKSSQDGSLWVGTRSYGAARFLNGEWQRFTVEDGLASNNIHFISETHDGEIWAKTQDGISRFDGERWAPNGLPVSFSSQPTNLQFHKSRDGLLWFTLAPYHTLSYRQDSDPPDTVLAPHPVDISQPGNITLSWSGSDKWHDTPKDELVYSWRINGKEWSPFASKLSQVFFSMEAGDHKFEVRARDRDFNIDPTPAISSFVVAEPVFRQFWFQAMLVTFAIVILVQAGRIISRNRDLSEAGLMLENRVKERTQDLNEAVGSLRSEIARREQTEGKLLAAVDEAEQANKAKSEFLAVMGHEIRTPLNAILGFSQLIPSESDEEVRQDFMQRIIQSSEHLLHLINEILDFTQLSNNKESFHFENVDLQKALREELANRELQAMDKGLRLDAHMTNGAPPEVVLDGTRFRQVIGNLLVNAVKFTQIGRIDVTMSAHPSRDRDSVWDVCIIVEDTGIGIPKDQIELIFEPFKQADSSLTRKFGGTGLGLSIVKRIVDGFGGKIECESSLNRGTRFIITFSCPEAVPDTNETQRQRSSMAKALGSARILVAEDEKNNQDVIRLMLRTLGLKPKIVEHGEAALDALREEAFDLIFMDIQMPRLNGLDTTTKIRSGECGVGKSNTPIVALTAFARATDRKLCIDAGMDDYISKPLKVENVQEIIKHYLEESNGRRGA